MRANKNRCACARSYQPVVGAAPGGDTPGEADSRELENGGGVNDRRREGAYACTVMRPQS